MAIYPCEKVLSFSFFGGGGGGLRKYMYSLNKMLTIMDGHLIIEKQV